MSTYFSARSGNMRKHDIEIYVACQEEMFKDYHYSAGCESPTTAALNMSYQNKALHAFKLNCIFN